VYKNQLLLFTKRRHCAVYLFRVKLRQTVANQTSKLQLEKKKNHIVMVTVDQ